MTDVDARHLQAHLRESARQRSQTARVGPFTAFFSPDSADPYLNFAVPDEPPEGRLVPVLDTEAKGLGAVPDDDPAYALVRLKEAFRARRRVARIEFVEGAAPGIAPLLRAAGFHEHARTPLYVATRASWTPADAPAGLRVEPVVPTTPWATTRRWLEVQQKAFGLAEGVPERAPAGWWPTLGIMAGLLATREGKAVAAGGFQPPVEGATQIAGLATLPDERPVAHFVANALAKVALDTGNAYVLILGDDEGARPAGAPPGFVEAGTLADWR